MRKFILAAATVATLAVPTAAMADAPNGQFVFKSNEASQGNSIGVQSSQIKQNGQFVGSGNNALGIDQTTTPGSRADIVQQQHALDGIGRDK